MSFFVLQINPNFSWVISTLKVTVPVSILLDVRYHFTRPKCCQFPVIVKIRNSPVPSLTSDLRSLSTSVPTPKEDILDTDSTSFAR